MGMYDEFRVWTNWLPEGKRIEMDEQQFQTKDLKNLLGCGVILEDGKLSYEEYDEEGGDIYDLPHTGQIRFYDLKNEFVAWCVNGVVKEVIDVTPC